MESLLSVMRHYISLPAAEEEKIATLFTPLTLQAKEFFLEEGKVCRRLAGYLFAAAVIIPFTDGLIVVHHNGWTDSGHIAIHWGTVLFSSIAVALLFSKGNERQPGQ